MRYVRKTRESTEFETEQHSSRLEHAVQYIDTSLSDIC
jgi:hypothetical protein